MTEKFYSLVVFDEELGKEIICLSKASSEYHAMNIAYSRGYPSVRIATNADRERITKRQQEEFRQYIANLVDETAKEMDVNFYYGQKPYLDP